MPSASLTIRLDADVRTALRRSARRRGTSVSDLVRTLLRDALAERPLAARAGHLKGRLELPGSGDAWRQELRTRNWRR